MEALEFEAGEDDGAVIGRPLRELRLRSNLLIACIIRRNKLIYPTGEDRIEKGDRVVVVTANKYLSDLEFKMKENGTKKYFVISHTHWDREWYMPFEQFRYRLLITRKKGQAKSRPFSKEFSVLVIARADPAGQRHLFTWLHTSSPRRPEGLKAISDP